MKKRKKRITVPVIMQMEALECGAASLAMILRIMASGYRLNKFVVIVEYQEMEAKLPILQKLEEVMGWR